MSLSGATVFGVGVYSVTQYPSGVGDDHRMSALTGGYSEEEWLGSMLEEYSRWSGEVRDELERNSQYLEWVQGLLVSGIFALVLTTLLLTVEITLGIPAIVTLGLVILGGAILLVRNFSTWGE